MDLGEKECQRKRLRVKVRAVAGCLGRQQKEGKAYLPIHHASPIVLETHKEKAGEVHNLGMMFKWEKGLGSTGMKNIVNCHSLF